MKQSRIFAGAACAALASAAGFAYAWTAPGHIVLRPHLIMADTLRDKSIPLTGTWQVDPWHTSAVFQIRHMGLSNVQGRFDNITGTVVANEADPSQSSVQVTIPTASIDTDVKMRDDDLRSPHYFDADKYPNITFQSTSISHKHGSRYIAVGDLTIHGVTKEISLPFEIYGPIKDPFGSPRFGLSTEITLDRLDYGVGAGDVLAGGQLAEGQEVPIKINLEAIPPAPPTPAPAPVAAPSTP